MARAAARSRRSRRSTSDAEPTFVSRLGGEVVGLLLLVCVMLACLAVATYSPADPILRLLPVENRAGAVGATVAGCPSHPSPTRFFGAVNSAQ